MINIASLAISDNILGPGRRLVIWVQGCPFRCPGCLAPDYQPLRPARHITSEAILDLIASNQPLAGLTYTGGEPMLQAPGLAELSRAAAGRYPAMTLIAFSGYTHEELAGRNCPPGADDLLECLDILVDGRYRQEMRTAIGLRGSSNQRILQLSGRIRACDLESWPHRLNVQVLNGQLLVTGFPNEAARRGLTRLDCLLKKEGLLDERIQTVHRHPQRS